MTSRHKIYSTPQPNETVNVTCPYCTWHMFVQYSFSKHAVENHLREFHRITLQNKLWSECTCDEFWDGDGHQPGCELFPGW